MPFTFSHPAAILPLRRTYLVFSALVVGSMAPDFLYFIWLTETSRWGHTLPGLFFFCLPMGLFVLWLFHRFLQKPILAIAPDTLRVRFSAEDLTFSFGPAARFVNIAIALMVGAITHDLWDDFTHNGGWIVQRVPWLRHELPQGISIYNILQHTSTVLGLIIIAVAYRRWVRTTDPAITPGVNPLSPETRMKVLGLIVVPAAILSLTLAYFTAQTKPEMWLAVFVVKTIIVSISASFVGVVIYAAAWHRRLNNRTRKNKAPDTIGVRG